MNEKDAHKNLYLETGQSLTKSGLYHRMKKITDLANKIRNKENI